MKREQDQHFHEDFCRAQGDFDVVLVNSTVPILLTVSPYHLPSFTTVPNILTVPTLQYPTNITYSATFSQS